MLKNILHLLDNNLYKLEISFLDNVIRKSNKNIEKTNLIKLYICYR